MKLKQLKKEFEELKLNYLGGRVTQWGEFEDLIEKAFKEGEKVGKNNS